MVVKYYLVGAYLLLIIIYQCYHISLIHVHSILGTFLLKY